MCNEVTQYLECLLDLFRVFFVFEQKQRHIRLHSYSITSCCTTMAWQLPYNVSFNLHSFSFALALCLAIYSQTSELDAILLTYCLFSFLFYFTFRLYQCTHCMLHTNFVLLIRYFLFFLSFRRAQKPLHQLQIKYGETIQSTAH